jgi:MFS family permease
MHALLIVAAAIVAVAGAARSTWSPCGVSMLATVTPLAEHGRGHRYRSTAAWFIAGGTLGGATLGLVMAAFALGVRAASASTVALAIVACAAAILAAASDTRLGGFRLPFHSRQVNERWLDQFRPWVYGAGFGWQIGAGLVTYIKTAALYLMIVLAALTASPAVALAVGALFGLTRGLAVLLGRGITSPTALAAFHRRFTDAGPVVLAVVVACELAVAVAFAAAVSLWIALALVLLGGAVALGGRAHRRTQEAAQTTPSRSCLLR